MIYLYCKTINDLTKFNKNVNINHINGGGIYMSEDFIKYMKNEYGYIYDTTTSNFYDGKEELDRDTLRSCASEYNQFLDKITGTVKTDSVVPKAKNVNKSLGRKIANGVISVLIVGGLAGGVYHISKGLSSNLNNKKQTPISNIK